MYITASAALTSCPSTGAAARRYLEGPYSLDHDLQLPPASLFTRGYVYPAEPGQGGRMCEKLRGPRRVDLRLVVEHTVQLLRDARYQ
jgi:hypothetical protein